MIKKTTSIAIALTVLGSFGCQIYEARAGPACPISPQVANSEGLEGMRACE